MPEGPKTTVLVAVIGVVGVLGAAAIANWDKLISSWRHGVDSGNSSTRPGGADPSKSQSVGSTDIAVVDVSLSPSVPVQGQPVNVTVTIANLGGTASSSFDVYWWPGENFPQPLTQTVRALAPGERTAISFTYPGYQSWYARLTTRVVADPRRLVSESAIGNNEWRREIAVRKP